MRSPTASSSTPVAAAVQNMRHVVYAINPKKKRQITAQIAARDGRTLLFTRTQLGAERVAQELIEVGIPAAALHGNKQQGLRTNVLAGFRQGAFDVLVATDVAARGIHIDDVSLVLHVDPSDDAKEYVHRSGRTARAGASGVVVTLALPHQKDKTRQVLEAAQVSPEWSEVNSETDEVIRYVGGRTPSGTPARDPQLVKYKGAPRKLDVTRMRGANSRNAAERRENEKRRAVYDENEKSPFSRTPGSGKGRRTAGKKRGSDARRARGASPARSRGQRRSR